MRELAQQEINAIAGGYSPHRPPRLSQRYQLTQPPDPLTVTFGTPVEPGLALPGILPNWHFR